jgi:hypothetical protein
MKKYKKAYGYYWSKEAGLEETVKLIKKTPLTANKRQLSTFAYAQTVIAKVRLTIDRKP